MFVLYDAMQKIRNFGNKCHYTIIKSKKMSLNIACGYILRVGIINLCLALLRVLLE